MKALILNTHSTLNSGDYAIVLAQEQYLNERFPGIRISLTSRTPSIDQAVYEPRGINVIPALFPAPSVFDASGRKLQKSLHNLVDLGSKTRLRREILDSDIVISSGGGYFYTSRRIGPGPMFLQNLAHVKFAQSLKRAVVFFPQSFGPIYNSLSLRLLSKLLNHEKSLRVYAREDISLEFLEGDLKVDNAKIEICPDMAFYLSQEALNGTEEATLDLPGPVVALTLRNWDFPEIESRVEKERKTNDYLQCLEDVCKGMYERWRCSFCLFPQVRGPGRFEDDREITRRFWRRLQAIIPDKHRKLLDPDQGFSPFGVRHLLAQTDLIIATRFHSAMLALLAGTPAIAITYQPKSLGMMRMLNQERFTLDIKNMAPDLLMDLAADVLDHTQDVKQKVLFEIAEARRRIERILAKEFQ